MTLLKTLSAITIVAIALTVSGCGMGSGNRAQQTVTTPPAVTAIGGKVHGGQQPISGSTIQLYAVGNQGLQSASTPLIGTTVTTASDGSFNITGDWNCTSNTAAYGTNPQLYLTASGGNPGLGAGGTNASIMLIAALGPCSSLSASSFVWVNEVTTVAAVYALAPFMKDITHVGATSALYGGLTDAFQVAAVLADTSAGVSPGPSLPENATAPIAEINTLANLIAGCVNSTGTGVSCQGLFAATTPADGTSAVDTSQALLNIARNPALNVATLFNMIPAMSPFAPTLKSAPNDWTVALKFTGGGLSTPTGVALDASGNAWIANAGGNSVTELSNTGVLLTGAAGYKGSGNIIGAQGIAVDRNGNVWVADTLLSSVLKLSVSSGAVQSSASFSSGGINGPVGLAIDSQNNVWVSNFAGGSVSELSNSGTPVGASPLTANGTLMSPSGIAIDATGNVWIADQRAGLLAEYNTSQVLLSGSGFTDGGILAPLGLAIDTRGRAWTADSGDAAISLFSANGTAVAASPLAGGSLQSPSAIAIDGAGTTWIANRITAGGMTATVASATSAPTAQLGSLNLPSAIATDASGNVWTTNAGDNSVSEFIGLASPVITPLAMRAGP